MSDATLRDQIRDALLAEGLAGPDTVDGIVSVALHVVEPTALATEVDAFHAEGGLRDDLVYDLARTVYPPADDLRDRLVSAIRKAAHWCDGRCNCTEDDGHELFVSVLTFDSHVEQVEGTPKAIVDAVMPVVQAEINKFALEAVVLAARLKMAEQERADFALGASAEAAERDNERQRAVQAEQERDEARAAVHEATEAIRRASSELAEAEARLDQSIATHTEHAKAITELSAELDEARAAVQRVRDLLEPSPDGSAIAIHRGGAGEARTQAVVPRADIIAALDQPEGS